MTQLLQNLDRIVLSVICLVLLFGGEMMKSDTTSDATSVINSSGMVSVPETQTKDAYQVILRQTFEQGHAITTDNPFDLMIEGAGYFELDILDDQGVAGKGYSRAGNFTLNSEGELVLGNSNGPRLSTVITIPPNAVSVNISQTGEVSYTLSGEQDPIVAGQIPLTSFFNPSGLLALDNNLFKPTKSSGVGIVGSPGSDGIGAVYSRQLEGSNVNAFEEKVALIKLQYIYDREGRTNMAAMDAIANNMANINTSGFRRTRVIVGALLHQHDTSADTSSTIISGIGIAAQGGW